MTYGILQEYYLSHWTFHGTQSAVEIIGTTTTGVRSLSSPILFPAFNRQWPHLRRPTAFAGVVLASLAFFASSFGTSAWHLVLTQGVLAALGCVMVYSPTTLLLSESFSMSNRALAYGVVLSSKNVTGSFCP